MRLFIKGFGFIFLIVGFGLLSYNIHRSFKLNSLISNANIVEGEVKVEELLEVTNAEKYLVYHIEFKYDNLTYGIKTSYNSLKKRFSIGDKVDVFVDKDDPMNSVINQNDETHKTQIIGYLLSFIFVFFGGLLIIVKYEKLEPLFKGG
ncbi:MAG: DUF3592 domain-containing protein [Flavobacteriales bacterium]|nr:DUF3592 domain-containing protein [Flavobacteriales bacterium]MCB9336442.1 DUF3592 domain-containing protein [Flavobacteriales bacterium]